jgi:CRISPR-associated protein Csm1
LKADVDRLGRIFSRGIQDPSLGRICSVSRALDFFFGGYLPELLRASFQDTYTVYAGGDDLLLIGPWRQTIDLASQLRKDFTKYVGRNPSITISAGIEIIKENHPLNRAARLAEERLSGAKHAGRDRISVIAKDPFSWPEFRKQQETAEPLTNWLREERLSQGFVYRILHFAAERRRAEGSAEGRAEGRAEEGIRLEAANWRSRWGYSLARNIDIRKPENQPVVEQLNALLGLDAHLDKTKEFVPPEAAITIALYRNRSGKQKERSNKQ